MQFWTWSAIEGVPPVAFVDHQGTAHADWLVDDKHGLAWVHQSWLCQRTNAPKYIRSSLKRPHPTLARVKIVPITDREPPVTAGDCNPRNAILDLIERFKRDVGNAITDWLLRRRAVTAINELPNRDAVMLALAEAGYGDIGQPAPSDLEPLRGQDFYNIHVAAIQQALRPVADACGTQTPLGRYADCEKETIARSLVVGNQHWSGYLTSLRKKSASPGGDRDRNIVALLRRWRLWRPHVVARLPDIQAQLANVFVGRHPLAAVAGLASEADVPPERLSLPELVKAGPLILSIRAMVKWKKSRDGEEKTVDNCHLRAVFTTHRGGAGPREVRPETYSLMYALQRAALPEAREQLEAYDYINHVLLDGFVKRKEMAPVPKRTPHPLTWIWYCVQLERIFWKAATEKPKSPDAAQALRVAILCQLSGGFISPTRSEEPGSLIMPGRKCIIPGCTAPDCHSNQVVLDPRPDHSHIIESHGKWEPAAKRAHQIAIPEPLAALFRQWFDWGRALCMQDVADHGFVLCSSQGSRIDSAYTISQAKRLLEAHRVDTSDWGELANVRDVRTSCLRKTPGPEGLAYWLNEAVKAEQLERNMEDTGLQGNMTDQQLLAVWDLLVRTGRTSGQQTERHYTSSVRSHTEMGELLELVRKHFVENEEEPPYRTDFVHKTGRRFCKSTAVVREAKRLKHALELDELRHIAENRM